MVLSPPGMAMREMKDSFPHSMVSLFVTLAFCLFFCLIYIFYPHRLASLFSAILLFNFSLIFVTGIIISMVHEGRLLIQAAYLWEFAFSCVFGWQLLFLYSVYYPKLSLRAWLIAGLMVTGILLMLFQSIWPTIVYPLAILLHPGNQKEKDRILDSPGRLGIPGCRGAYSYLRRFPFISTLFYQYATHTRTCYRFIRAFDFSAAPGLGIWFR